MTDTTGSRLRGARESLGWAQAELEQAAHSCSAAESMLITPMLSRLKDVGEQMDALIAAREMVEDEPEDETA